MPLPLVWGVHLPLRACATKEVGEWVGSGTGADLLVCSADINCVAGELLR